VRQPAEPREKSSGAGKIIFTVLLFVAAIAVAFLVGQSTRPSSAEVDRNTSQAVQTARQSAANSYRRAFEKIQAEAAAAVEAAQKKARAQGLAEGEANAQSLQQEDSQSIFDKVTGCVVNGNC
jgi:flagellar biosynthesis/type III secretory pathway protein FliH